MPHPHSTSLSTCSSVPTACPSLPTRRSSDLGTGAAHRPASPRSHLLLHDLRLDDVELAGLQPRCRRHRDALRRLAFPSRPGGPRSEEHTSELQSRDNLVCRLLLEKKKNQPAT